jgi:hypothetical protein
MSLLTKTRTNGDPAPSATDELVRVYVQQGANGREIWCEWKIQLPSGRYDYRSAQVDADVVTTIADANFDAKMLSAADNTYPKVTA